MSVCSRSPTAIPMPLAAAHGGRHASRVERGDRLRRERHVFAEQRTQSAVVGLDLVLAQLVRRLDEAHSAHVELLAHDLHQALDRCALAPVGHDHRLGQRLAHLDLRLRPGAQAEPDGLARDRHRLAPTPRRAPATHRPRGSRTGARSQACRRGCRRSHPPRTGRRGPAAWRRSAGTRATSRTRPGPRPRSAGANGARTSWRGRRRARRSLARRLSRRRRPGARPPLSAVAAVARQRPAIQIAYGGRRYAAPARLASRRAGPLSPNPQPRPASTSAFAFA